MLPGYCRGKDFSQGGSCSSKSSTWKVRYQRYQHLHLPDLLHPNWQSLDPQVSNHPLVAVHVPRPAERSFTALIGSKSLSALVAGGLSVLLWFHTFLIPWSFVPWSFTSSIVLHSRKQFSCLCNRNSLLHQTFSAHELCNALNQLIDSLLTSQPVMPVSVGVSPSKSAVKSCPSPMQHRSIYCRGCGLRNFR